MRIFENIESLIANNILEDKIKYNSTITIDVQNNNFIIIVKKYENKQKIILKLNILYIKIKLYKKLYK